MRGREEQQTPTKWNDSSPGTCFSNVAYSPGPPPVCTSGSAHCKASPKAASPVVVRRSPGEPRPEEQALTEFSRRVAPHEWNRLLFRHYHRERDEFYDKAAVPGMWLV